MSEYPFVSVVVPAKNTESIITECLESIKNSTFRNFELLVVDGHSTDKTPEIAQSLGANVIPGINKGLTADYNVGFKNARGEIVAFTDADCVVDKHWLEKIVKCFDDLQVGIAGGPDSTYLRNANAVERAAGHVHAFYRLLATKEGADAVIGCNCAYRRSCLIEVGGFDESLPGCVDTEINSRILEKGYKVIVDPTCIVYHKRKNSLVRVVRDYWTYGVDMGVVHHRAPHRLKERIKHIYPLIAGLLIFLLLIGLSFKFSALIWVVGALLLFYFIFQLLIQRWLKIKTGFKSNFFVFLLVSTLSMVSYAAGFIKWQFIPHKGYK